MGRRKPDGSKNEDGRKHGAAEMPLPGKELGGIRSSAGQSWQPDNPSSAVIHQKLPLLTPSG